MGFYSRLTLALLSGCWLAMAQAALFEDDEARRAIIDLRQRMEAQRTGFEKRIQGVLEESLQAIEKSSEESAQYRRSLLDLQNQIEAVRRELSQIRGQGEQLARELAEFQRQQKDLVQLVDDRLRKFEPIKVSLDGKEFAAEPAEKRGFESALAIFRKGDFAPAQFAFDDFVRRYPQSGYLASALFWQGNAQYANRNYKEAVSVFRSLLAQAPDHVRAPEAVLSIANCQIELKDLKAARKTLEELLKAYPQSEAAAAAKERLARLK